MSVWKKIPKDGNIDHKDMVIVRKPNSRGGWGVELAYKSVANGWRINNGAAGIRGYTEYTPIPS